MAEGKLTHFNDSGRARMVNVGEKDETIRTAVAKGCVVMNAETFALATKGGMKKGDVLAVAQVAGIMGAKSTSQIIPMCHPIAITGVNINFTLHSESSTIDIESVVTCKGVTGVEMEALTAVSTAALTIYDMCKAVQKDIVIDNIRLIEKSGGKSGHFVRQGE